MQILVAEMLLFCRNNTTINVHVKTQNRVKYRVWHTDPWPDPTRPKSLTRWPRDPVTPWPVTRRPDSISDIYAYVNCANLSPVYTIQPVVKPAWQTAVSCIQPVVKPVVKPGCTTGLTTVWRTDCSFNTVVKPVFKPVWQPVWQPVECLFTRYSRLSNRLYNRFENQLCRVNGVL